MNTSVYFIVALSLNDISTVIIVVQIQSHNLVLLIKSIEGSFRSSSRKYKNCRQILPDLKRQGQEVTENYLFINCYHIHHFCSNLANFAETSPSDDKERE